MITFLVIAGMVIWGLLTIGLLLGGVMWAAGSDYAKQVVVRLMLAVVLSSVSGTGFGMTIAANGWFDGTTLPDGCYAVAHDTQLMPMVVGKVTTVIPYDHTNFIPIGCPR